MCKKIIKHGIAIIGVALLIFLSVASASDDAAKMYKSGEEHFNNKEYDAAIADYTEAIRLNPNNNEYLFRRAFAYESKGDYDNALADWDRYIQLEPKNYRAFNNRGVAYEEKGDTSRAIADYETALHLSPDYSIAKRNLERIRQKAPAITQTQNVPSFNTQQQTQAINVQQQVQQPQTPTNNTQPQAVSEDDFHVKQLPGNVLAIIGYKGSAKNVVIPATLYGLKVTTIGERAFKADGLTSVVIPDSVTEIEDGDSGYKYGAFWENKLASVTLGKGLKKIGSFAFYKNKELKEVVIPDSVTEIADGAFQECGIRKLTLGKNVEILRGFVGNELTELVIPSSVKEIGGFGNNKLTELVIPPSVKTIGESCFLNNQLKTLTIPNTVTAVGKSAFAYNPIETLVIPASLAKTGIGDYAFGGCPLTRITMPANMDDYALADGWNRGAFSDQNFVTFYKDQKKAAGTYVKRGPIWTKE